MLKIEIKQTKKIDLRNFESLDIIVWQKEEIKNSKENK